MPRSNESIADEATDVRLDRLEREMVREGSIEMAAVRRLLHGLSDAPTDADPVAKVDAIVERIDTLETEVQRLEAQLRAQRNQQKGTKKERAKRRARNEVLRQIDRGTNPMGGGSVDVPTVITMGHGLGVEFTHKTIGDAFRALATEWDCFELQDGSGTKEGANKRLVATGDDVPEALWQLYEAETGEEATRENAFAESSDRPNRGA
ncbi:hypothetical protein [Halalkalicoccus ordinarius]|uniref:hypothetical protein n=1 Tax=Halalkalicoccus ordinarius TaxID=3116651 RepID=UPI00300F54CB